MTTTASTPPHLPTYQVCLSEHRIRTILTTVFPNLEVISIEQLESGKSYNNRIYFIDAERNGDQSAVDSGRTRLVLKLAGHFFDHRKIENELGCLLLLKKYCPQIPVPSIFAWSADGQKIESVDGRAVQAPDRQPFSDHPWILTSRLPGKTLSAEDLDSEHGPAILKQLAAYMTMWRTQIPSANTWGNLRIRAAEEVNEESRSFPDLTSSKSLVIETSLLHTFPWPITGRYYPTSAMDQLARLEKESQFQWSWNTHGESWKRWADEELSHQPLCQPNECVFTHLDFSPRNILVSDDAGVLKVTGVLDFEFSGFFPPQEEFLNAMIRQNTDWEEHHWEIIMRELAKLGQKAPAVSGVAQEMCFNATEWKQACLIVNILDRLAPWEIMANKFSEQQLQEELESAAKVVNESLAQLRLLNTRRPKP